MPETKKPDNWYDAMKMKSEPLPSLSIEEDGSIPDEFLFESKLIFISNLDEIPSAIGDRVLSIQLNYSKEQALELINQKLEHLVPEYPDLTLDDKKEILSFIRKHKNKTARISLRTFIHIASIWKSNHPNREAWALVQLKSQLN